MKRLQLPRDPHLWRSRWAAIGAAVAVSLGAGGIALVSADSAPSSLVAITPARILDTRTNLGLSGPFVSATSRTLQVTGAVPTPAGSATVVPTGATAVSITLTSVESTARGFMSVRPGGTPGAPTTSNLNFEAGQTIANTFTVQLSATGTLDVVYDALGTLGPTSHVLVDVNGYFMANPGPPAVGTQVVPFSTTLAFGEDATIVERGSSRLIARCLTDDVTDRIQIVATSTQAGWFSGATGSTPQAAGAEVVIVENTAAAGAPLYTQRIDRGHMMSPDGSYLAYQQETTSMALNVFGQDCVVAGVALSLPVDLAVAP